MAIVRLRSRHNCPLFSIFILAVFEGRRSGDEAQADTSDCTFRSVFATFLSHFSLGVLPDTPSVAAQDGRAKVTVQTYRTNLGPEYELETTTTGRSQHTRVFSNQGFHAAMISSQVFSEYEDSRDLPTKPAAVWCARAEQLVRLKGAETKFRPCKPHAPIVRAGGSAGASLASDELPSSTVRSPFAAL